MTRIGERAGARTTTWFHADDCSLDDLRAVVEVPTDKLDYPHAVDVVDSVPVYDCDQLRTEIASPGGRRSIQSELVVAMSDGPGLVVFAGAFPDTSVVDRVTEVFEAIIADQHAAGQPAGDHYAKPGANDRIWNALEKLALRDPDAFVEYYGNQIIELVSAAWLGPNFQITSQVNVVNPGGAAQVPHRDYHLGFQSVEIAQEFPAHAHRLSAVLTLQGAVAHTDMPVESGPTMYLPHSQKYELGYLGWRRPDFAEYFAEHHVQLPLRMGDAAFFNPALSHAAGHNRTADVKRMANLMQVSSAFGRPIETVNREAVSNAVFPALLRRAAAGVPEVELRNAIAAAAEGYPFPTNLDRDQPIGGMTPDTQAELLWRAVGEDWAPDALRTALRAYAERHLTHTT
jgi:ectoine hydroxylase-related dioxygenase (phytanoyl-CoA dioxygenase family)